MSSTEPVDEGTGGIEAVAEEAEKRGQTGEEQAASTSQEAPEHPVPVTTPSISMSAGADPWADPPPAAAMASGISASKRSGGDNPWASNTPDLAAEAAPFDSGSIPEGEEGRERSTTESFKQDERWGEYHLPKLGNAVARYWSFKPGFLQLNSGSYGACPKPVCEAYKALQDRQEENPDLFRKVYMDEMLSESRAKVAKILNCPAKNVVLVPNSTTGTNAVLRDLVYQSDDAILFPSIGYGAVGKNIDYLVDTEKLRGVRLHKVPVPLTMPMSKPDILQALKRAIDEAQGQGKRIRIAIIDTISSRPGLRLPWEEMVGILRERQILSLVDGAHGIGHIPIDLTATDPDFFVSNCHKWMYAHRGCAVFYVASRNLHLQRTSLPTSWFYTSDPSEKSNSWVQQWAGPGTLDVSPLLSIDAALEFRQKMGGEERIMGYTRDLAIRGGKAAAQILDTCVMDLADNALTAGMVNVQLPIIKSRTGADAAAWMDAADPWFFSTLHKEFKTCLTVFEYHGKIWARFSAQIWLEVADFEYGARALLELSKRINEGNAPDFRRSQTGEVNEKPKGPPPVDG